MSFLDALPVFVNIRRRYCRIQNGPKIKHQTLFVASPNIDGFYVYFTQRRN